MKPDFLTKPFLLIPVFMTLCIIGVHSAFGQTATVQGTAGNLQFLPQQAYIYTEPPIGVQPQQQNMGFNINDIISGLTGGGLAGLYAKFKSDQNKKTTQEVAQTQVKIADAQQQLAQQTYENMADKGESIKDKPAIQNTELQKVKDKAVETATKS